jgi:hypothetical protein
MSSAVQNLQKAICKGEKSVTQMLMEAKLLASKLNLPELEQWVDYELKGYPENFTPPSFRKIKTSHLEILHPIQGWGFAAPLSVELAVARPLTEIENLSKTEKPLLLLEKKYPIKDCDGELCDWPQAVILPAQEFQKILESVKHELLQCAINLEKRGITGEDVNFDDNEKQAASTMVFNIGNVQGNVGSVTHSPTNFYDYRSINQLLIERNVPKAERRELEDIMDEMKSAPLEKRPTLIQRGKDWIVKNKEFLGATAEVIGKAVGAAIESLQSYSSQRPRVERVPAWPDWFSNIFPRHGEESVTGDGFAARSDHAALPCGAQGQCQGEVQRSAWPSALCGAR